MLRGNFGRLCLFRDVRALVHVEVRRRHGGYYDRLDHTLEPRAVCVRARGQLLRSAIYPICLYAACDFPSESGTEGMGFFPVPPRCFAQFTVRTPQMNFSAHPAPRTSIWMRSYGSQLPYHSLFSACNVSKCGPGRHRLLTQTSVRLRFPRGIVHTLATRRTLLEYYKGLTESSSKHPSLCFCSHHHCVLCLLPSLDNLCFPQTTVEFSAVVLFGRSDHSIYVRACQEAS